MKRTLVPILGLALAGGLITACLASADQTYVCNRLYQGRVDKAAGPAWLELDDFNRAAHLDVTAGPVSNGHAMLQYHGQSWSIPAESGKGGMYVDVRALVDRLGGTVIFNNSLGYTAINVPTEAVYGAADQASSTASPAATSKSPLRVAKFSVTDNSLPPSSNVHSSSQAFAQITGTVVLQNTGDSYVDGVDEIVHIQDGYGNDVDTVKNTVGKIEPGKSISWDWTWNNSSSLVVHEVVEVQHNPYYTKAERDNFDKTKTTPPAGKKISIRSGPTEGVPESSATVGGAAGGYSTTAPNASSSAYQAPTETANPPGFGASDTSTASATSTNPPGF